MRIEFFGVRGSIASPGPETAKVGGNTSCVAVECGGTTIILDAGTGLRGLGNRLIERARAMKPNTPPSIEATLLLSHVHWDHIQGLPFFLPLYLPSTSLVVAGTQKVRGLAETLSVQMSAPHFPVCFRELGSKVELRDVAPHLATHFGEATVYATELDHPGGVTAYRIEHGGRSVVYATDVEHPDMLDPRLVDLARDADVLIYDAQYTPEEYPAKRGWGHSTFTVGTEIAKAANVGELLLFHHDPSRDDDAVAKLETRARELFAPTTAAREGHVISLIEDRLDHVSETDLEPAPDSRAA